MKKIAVGQLYLLTREDDGESFEAVVTWTDGAFMCLTDGCCDYKHWPDSPGTPVLLEERAGWWDDKGPPDTDIVVWAWDDAPEEYRELSLHGGDEDWVVFCPGRKPGEPAPEVPHPWMFAMGHASAHRILGGTLYIFAHA